jgi:hypothetical protein
MAKRFETTSQQKKLGMVAYDCHPNYIRNHKIGGSHSRLAKAKSETLSQNNQSKKGLVEWLKQ